MTGELDRRSKVTVRRAGLGLVVGLLVGPLHLVGALPLVHAQLPDNSNDYVGLVGAMCILAVVAFVTMAAGVAVLRVEHKLRLALALCVIEGGICRFILDHLTGSGRDPFLIVVATVAVELAVLGGLTEPA